ncbi:helix-turn-helix domain-containing protein [Desemzia incerta]|uniref:helix-turn-helix domain-containing protein n=1 Tax=Desemzia incerta TaxID=82801 RepID=UPI003D0698C1
MKASSLEVGQRIKSIRQSKGMTLEDFAKLINATVPAVSNWENGRNLPNNERLVEIAKQGKTSVNELLYGPSKNYETMWRQLKEQIENVTNDEFGNPAIQYYLKSFLEIMNKLEEEV